MSDFGDDALDAQERHLRRSLAKMGIRPKDEIPPPRIVEPAIVCHVCGARCAEALCPQCQRQLDKGSR